MGFTCSWCQNFHILPWRVKSCCGISCRIAKGSKFHLLAKYHFAFLVFLNSRLSLLHKSLTQHFFLMYLQLTVMKTGLLWGATQSLFSKDRCHRLKSVVSTSSKLQMLFLQRFAYIIRIHRSIVVEEAAPRAQGTWPVAVSLFLSQLTLLL